MIIMVITVNPMRTELTRAGRCSESFTRTHLLKQFYMVGNITTSKAERVGNSTKFTWEYRPGQPSARGLPGRFLGVMNNR